MGVVCVGFADETYFASSESSFPFASKMVHPPTVSTTRIRYALRALRPVSFTKQILVLILSVWPHHCSGT